jgi:hypothetical protein
MAGIDCNLIDDVCKVRVKIADASLPFLFSDETIQAFLDANNGNIMKASVELLIYCITVASGKSREEVGDVEVDWPTIFKQKSLLLEKIQTDPSFGAAVALPILGGTSASEKERVSSNADNVKPYVKTGEFTSSPEGDVCGDPESIYRMGCK